MKKKKKKVRGDNKCSVELQVLTSEVRRKRRTATRRTNKIGRRMKNRWRTRRLQRWKRSW